MRSARRAPGQQAPEPVETSTQFVDCFTHVDMSSGVRVEETVDLRGWEVNEAALSEHDGSQERPFPTRSEAIRNLRQWFTRRRTGYAEQTWSQPFTQAEEGCKGQSICEVQTYHYGLIARQPIQATSFCLQGIYEHPNGRRTFSPLLLGMSAGGEPFVYETVTAAAYAARHVATKVVGDWTVVPPDYKKELFTQIDREMEHDASDTYYERLRFWTMVEGQKNPVMILVDYESPQWHPGEPACRVEAFTTVYQEVRPSTWARLWRATAAKLRKLRGGSGRDIERTEEIRFTKGKDDTRWHDAQRGHAFVLRTNKHYI
jgi:hypothetical protein